MKNSKYQEIKKLILTERISTEVVGSQILIDLLKNWKFIPKEKIEDLVEEYRKIY